jgi:hypothetical protein
MVITCVIMNDAQCVTSMKRIKQKDSQTTWKKTNIILNSSDGIRKSKTKTRYVHDMNVKGLYYKNITRI